MSIEEFVDYENLIPSVIQIMNVQCNEINFKPFHVAAYHSFMFILSGEGQWLSEGRSQAIRGPMLIYHSPGQKGGCFIKRNKRMHILGIQVHLAYAYMKHEKWIWREAKALPLHHITELQKPQMLLMQLEKLIGWWEDSASGAGLQCRSLFLSILSELYRIAVQDSPSPEEQAIRPAVRYIEKYYKEKITLQQLSREVGLTPSYFGKLFKAATGDSPITYVHRIRVEKAKELLGIGFTFSEIAAMVGFDDPFYFSKVFKKIAGLSPRAYLHSLSGTW